MGQQGGSLSADIARQRQQLEQQEYMVWRLRRELRDEEYRREQMRGALTVLERLQQREQAAIQAMQMAVAADRSNEAPRHEKHDPPSQRQREA